MAWYGANHGLMRDSLTTFIGYWGIFLSLMGVSLFIAFLDLRYIRMQYALGRRELYRQTLGDEEFRRRLIEAQKRQLDRNGD